MKLWSKENSKQVLKNIETFTVGKDREMDLELAEFDVYGSMAHAIMLEKIKLLSQKELDSVIIGCKEILNDISEGNFEIQEGIEDVHSQVEFLLTQKIGEAGKKIHSGRSRNDQVLVDLKMYLRHQLYQITLAAKDLFDILINKSEEHKAVLLPGYTHFQIAMPSSFGLWFAAYAESLLDDLIMIHAAFEVVNKNPLGSGAGYGSSFPLDRDLTADLLGFEALNVNVVYAQMTRGKAEYISASALSNIANTLSKLAMDVCVYNSQNFGFITLPEEMTTGSSIMPHKKNPDVAEILRGKSNLLKALPIQVNSLLSNLPSGYHREFQLLKEVVFPAIKEISSCIEMAHFMVSHMKVNTNILNDPKYDLIFSVENVNKLVLEGVPFRDAYKITGEAINEGNFTPEREINHTLQGSIGNLQNDRLKNAMDAILQRFNFEKIEKAYRALKEN